MNELLVDMQGFIDERTNKATEGNLMHRRVRSKHSELYKQLGAAVSDNPEAKEIWFDIDDAHHGAVATAATAAYTQGFLDGLKMR